MKVVELLGVKNMLSSYAFPCIRTGCKSETFFGDLKGRTMKSVELIISGGP